MSFQDPILIQEPAFKITWDLISFSLLFQLLILGITRQSLGNSLRSYMPKDEQQLAHTVVIFLKSLNCVKNYSNQPETGMNKVKEFLGVWVLKHCIPRSHFLHPKFNENFLVGFLTVKSLPSTSCQAPPIFGRRQLAAKKTKKNLFP